jgi:hypothetical protein
MPSARGLLRSGGGLVALSLRCTPHTGGTVSTGQSAAVGAERRPGGGNVGGIGGGTDGGAPGGAPANAGGLLNCSGAPYFSRSTCCNSWRRPANVSRITSTFLILLGRWTCK